MKHYLDLIPISEKVHRRQSRMTRACIFLAVFLVTVIFSMADMQIRTEKTRPYSLMESGMRASQDSRRRKVSFCPHAPKFKRSPGTE